MNNLNRKKRVIITNICLSFIIIISLVIIYFVLDNFNKRNNIQYTLSDCSYMWIPSEQYNGREDLYVNCNGLDKFNNIELFIASKNISLLNNGYKLILNIKQKEVKK